MSVEEEWHWFFNRSEARKLKLASSWAVSIFCLFPLWFLLSLELSTSLIKPYTQNMRKLPGQTLQEQLQIKESMFRSIPKSLSWNASLLVIISLFGMTFSFFVTTIWKLLILVTYMFNLVASLIGCRLTENCG